MGLWYDDPNVNNVESRSRTPLLEAGTYRLRVVEIGMAMRGTRQTVIGEFEVLESNSETTRVGDRRACLWMVAGTRYPEIAQGRFKAFCDTLSGDPALPFGKLADDAINANRFDGHTIRVQVTNTEKKAPNGKPYTNETWFADGGASAPVAAPEEPAPALPLAPPPPPVAGDAWTPLGFEQHPASDDHVWNPATREVRAKASF